MRIALIQMPVLPDKVKNIQTACGKIREAAKNCLLYTSCHGKRKPGFFREPP